MEKINCEVSEAPIDSARFVAEIAGVRSHGAQAFFFGAVRDLNFGKQVEAVSYDAFVPLAEQVLREIGAEARGAWGEALVIRISHRTGRLGVGELSVGIGVSSPHRDEAFKACRYVIEEIKKRVPIWKKEHYADGETEWVKGHALCQGHAHAHAHK